MLELITNEAARFTMGALKLTPATYLRRYQTFRPLKEVAENQIADYFLTKIFRYTTKMTSIKRQIKLELTYLTNPAIFDRDGATRRSEGRMKLKDRTGMDDGQLEGWRVMLERNVRLLALVLCAGH